jgi:hypothetical protein
LLNLAPNKFLAGNFNPRGFEMTTDVDGKPRFALSGKSGTPIDDFDKRLYPALPIILTLLRQLLIKSFKIWTFAVR